MEICTTLVILALLLINVLIIVPHTSLAMCPAPEMSSGGDGTWQIETVDSTEDVGAYTSLALDASNQSHIRCYDGTNGYLD
jgi:hypothetical protein